MEIIYLLIPLSLVLAMVAIGAFFWASKNGQFDDLDSPGLDILDYDSEHVITEEKVSEVDGQQRK